MNTLDSTIPRDEFRNIEDCKSPRTKMTAKLYPLVDQVDSLEYNAFLTDKQTGYNPLYFTLKFFYQKYDWKIDFGITDMVMSNFSFAL